jgi:hypothetical protein
MIIGAIVSAFLVFILVFLQPFNSNEFTIKYKTLVLSVYGVIFFLNYFIHVLIENYWYRKHKNTWRILNELISLSIFFLVMGSLAYIYNELFINKRTYELSYHIGYFKHVISVFIPMFLPLLITLRLKHGVLTKPKEQSQITIKGANKREELIIQRNQLLFIKASENYVEIYYLDDTQVKSEIFRNTLFSVAKQFPFLLQSHRSYLVNQKKIKELKGNSQKASIVLLDSEIEIPVSKSFYKKIKKGYLISPKTILFILN